MITIVDVSGYQKPPLNWDAARQAGIEAVIVKQTEGVTHESPTWLTHAKQAHDAGLIIGVYHLAWPGEPIAGDAEKEARAFVDNINDLEAEGIPLDLYPALDLEKGKKRIKSTQLIQWVDVFCEVVCGLLQIERLTIYANKSYTRTLNRGAKKLGCALGLGYHRLWIAGDTPNVPEGIWTSADLWQTPQRKVEWYDGDIDCNVVTRGIDRLMSSFPLKSQPESDAIIDELMELQHRQAKLLAELRAEMKKQ